MNFLYKNKYFSVLGDSISTLEWYSVPSEAAFYAGMRKFESDVFAPEDTWWGQVIHHLGGQLLVNNSISGSMVSKHPRYDFPSYACSDERTSGLHLENTMPDIIMVFAGINDWGMGVRLTPDDETRSDNISVFSVAYQSMLQKLQKNYPDAEIWCFTLPIAKFPEGEDFPYCRGGTHIDEYSRIIRDCANRHTCRVIELNNAEPYSTFDGFHPNIQGMTNIADTIISQL